MLRIIDTGNVRSMTSRLQANSAQVRVPPPTSGTEDVGGVIPRNYKTNAYNTVEDPHISGPSGISQHEY